MRDHHGAADPAGLLDVREVHRKALLRFELEAVRLLIPRITDPVLFEDRELRFTAVEGPSGKSFEFGLDVSEWNLEPPGLAIYRSRGGKRLDRPWEWPCQSDFTFQEPHPVTGGTWACVKGLRDYHLHPDHKNDPWDLRRNHWNLARVVEHVLEELNKPRKRPPITIPRWTKWRAQ